MGSTAINTRIQGTGADQKHLAIAVIKDYLRKVGGRFLFDRSPCPCGGKARS